MSLSELGILSLDLFGQPDATVVEGNVILGRTSFTRENGTTGEAGDVALRFFDAAPPAPEHVDLDFGPAGRFMAELHRGMLLASALDLGDFTLA